jgi:hypothetical protein
MESVELQLIMELFLERLMMVSNFFYLENHGIRRDNP